MGRTLPCRSGTVYFATPSASTISRRQSFGGHRPSGRSPIGGHVETVIARGRTSEETRRSGVSAAHPKCRKPASCYLPRRNEIALNSGCERLASMNNHPALQGLIAARHEVLLGP